MKIAIHHEPGSFSERWIAYCDENSIPYKLVNAYDSDIIKQVEDCDVFMWHHNHADYRDKLFAKQLLFSLQTTGKRVFPNFCTGWHFDDKVGQKYLLEAVGAPLVPSYVFYTKKEAMKWAEQTTFPKVFKLRGGAGSSNVRLVRNKSQANKLINKAFGRGFSQLNRWGNLKERFKKWRNGFDTFTGVCRGFARLFIPTEFSKLYIREKGYVYFQDFAINNPFDIRVIVIGNKAFAIKRLCRPHDFRASGSGNIIYDVNEIDLHCVELSFKYANSLSATCIGFDWLFSTEREPLIVEIGYGFAVHGYDSCPGYWTDDMAWHEGKFVPQNWMVENILK